MSETIDFNKKYNLEWSQTFILNGKTYTARVANGEAAEKYRSAQIAGSVFRQSTKEVAIGNIGTVENVLVGHCCYGQDNLKVGPLVVKGWPAPVIKDLFDLIKENSNLEEDSEDSDNADIPELNAKIQELQNKVMTLESDALGEPQSGTMFGSD